MAQKKTVPLIGRLAVHLKMIDMNQLAAATAEQGRGAGDRHLGEILLEQGAIDRTQLAKLVAAQRQVMAKQREKAGGPAKRSTVAATPAGSARRPASAPEPPAHDPVRTTRSEAAGTEAAARPGADAVEASSPPAAVAPATAAPVSMARIGDDLAAPDDSDHQAFEALLRDAVERGASDIHIHSGAPIGLRIGGALTCVGEPLDAARAERMVVCALRPEERASLAAHGEMDICHSIEGIGRFRANLYRQQRGIDGVFRFISGRAPTLEELGLPSELAKHTNYHQGMVLVTGPTGCGKSSTLAALVNLVNEERSEHILTIEDPIEYLHPSKRCLVNQRSVNRHTESFARALRAALREDPDVIVIGELRDLETISLALTAAETGHFVLATLHTDNAIRTVNRVIGAYPADQQEQIRSMLSVSLRAVISQRLLPRADGSGRVAAHETLVVTKAVGNLIRENKTFQIHSILQTGASQGMRLLDHSIREHVKSGAVSREEAARHVEDEKTLAA